VFCPQETLSYANEDYEAINVTFPTTKAGYSNTSVEECPAETSGGKSITVYIMLN